VHLNLRVQLLEPGQGLRGCFLRWLAGFECGSGGHLDDKFPDQRGIDRLCAVWNVLDVTPEGRDDWYAELSYSNPARAAGRVA